ncbi:MAG: iron export ABC transporter permease subunit FetB [Firmicutes bacterium]|nr:iron export ABC transporter permease subunit FetB [Bacillota bacterium]
MNGIIDIRFAHLVAAYFFVLIVLGMLRKRKIGKETELIIAVFRMTIQLVLVGYILDYIFGSQNMWLTLLAVGIMEVFAVRNVYQRVKINMSPAFRKVVAYSMAFGTLLSMAFFFYVVLSLKPWYSPRYVIPLAGMLIGNSMTGITLGTERLLDGVRSNRHLIEGALMLGATPERAAQNVVNNAFSSAILPTINSMVGMGIVFLPGMMTGQILSGTSPLIAIEYQIAIMLGILGSVALTVFIMVNQGVKTFFNSRAQLVLTETPKNGRETK